MKGKTVGKYYGDLRVAVGKAKFATLVLLLVALAYPVAVQTVLHPTEAIGLGYWFQGQAVPRYYTVQQVTAGELQAVGALVVLSLFMLGATILFYRKANYSVALWPAIGVMIGIVGNAAWWLYSGYFDRIGALAGITSLVMMGMCEALCEHFGQDFVFGKGVRPQRA